MAKRVALVTGGCGFIGRHTLPHLVARGFEVHVISRQKFSKERERQVAGALSGTIFFHSGIDLHNTDVVTPCIQEIRASHLLHLAWDARHGIFWNSTENLDWIVSSKLLTQAFIAQGGTRIVAAGTCAEYDWNSNDLLLDEEESNLLPLSMYGQCKVAFRKTLATLTRHHNVSSAWGRIFFLFGPYEGPKRLVSSAILALLRGEEFPASIGDQLRDFLFVDDVAQGFAALLDSTVQGDVNIASGQASSVAEVLTHVGKITGRPELIRLGARDKQPHEPARLVAAVERLKNEVGYKPSRSLRQGLQESVEWWREVGRGKLDSNVGG
jgi:nucleoside-diphosphate-sugar epimerase